MDDEYDVPSPHAHALEQAVGKEHDGLSQKIALMTAILATDPKVKARFLTDRVKEDTEKTKIQAEAIKLQAASRELGVQSEVTLRPHKCLALAVAEFRGIGRLRRRGCCHCLCHVMRKATKQ